MVLFPLLFLLLRLKPEVIRRTHRWCEKHQFHQIFLMVIAAVQLIAARSVPEGRTVNNLRC